MSRGILKVAENIDVSLLHTALLRNETLWNRQKIRNVGPHRDADDIWVRCNDIRNLDPAHPELFMAPHDSVWYPEYDELHEIDRIVFPLMGVVKGERLGGILITRIGPGKMVYPHVDPGWHANYYDKYAVQVAGGPGQAFCFNDGFVESRTGDICWFDNQVPHWVVNQSTTDRITMIVCIRHSKSRGS